MASPCCPMCGTCVEIADLAEGVGGRAPCPRCGALLGIDPLTGAYRIFGDFAEADTLVTDGAMADQIRRARDEAIAGPAPATDEVRGPAEAPVSAGASGDDAAGAAGDDAASGPSGEEGDIPGYEVLALLGEGGMAVVYKARQLSLERIVALKVLAERLADDETFVRRFEKEARALANLNHPNITSVYDRGIAGKRYYLSMEYVDGESLREGMRRGEIDCNRALEIVRGVCEALDYTHGKGIIHRDVKPENILINREGQVKVSDFGLAAMTEDSSASTNLTKANIMVGTVNYVAPEQRRDARSVDHRADLYAVGVVLYEVLTGKLPIGVCEPASQVNADVDLRVDEIVDGLLQQDPEKRTGSAHAVVEAIDAILGNPLHPIPSPGGQPLLPAGPAPVRPRDVEGLDALVKRAAKDITRKQTRGIPTQIRARPEGGDGLSRRRGPCAVLLLAVLFVGVVLAAAAYVEEPSLVLWFASDLPGRTLGPVWSPTWRARLEAFVAHRYPRRRAAYEGRIRAALSGKVGTLKVGALRVTAVVRKDLPWRTLVPLAADPSPAVRAEIIALLEQRMPADQVEAVDQALRRLRDGGHEEDARRLEIVLRGLREAIRSDTRR